MTRPPLPRAFAVCAALLTTLMFTAPLAAQAPDDALGRVSTNALGDVATGQTVLIDVLDDTELNLRLRDIIAQSLEQHGFEPAAAGRYTLVFQTQEIHNLSGDGGIGELSVSTREGIRMHMNLWSSTRDSLLANRSQNATDSVRLLHLDMTLRDRNDGKVVWQGQSFAEARGADRFMVFRQMVPQLVERIGETHDIETFPID